MKLRPKNSVPSLTSLTHLFSLLSLLSSQAQAQAQTQVSYSLKGCYAASDIQALDVSSRGKYIYQSPSYCQKQCAGSEFYALFNGGDCYCGDDISQLLSLSPVSGAESCDVKCFGWPGDTCGGSNAMNVYVNDAVAATAAVAGSSTLSTSSDLYQSSSTTTATAITTPTTPAVEYSPSSTITPDTTTTTGAVPSSSSSSSSSTQDYRSVESSYDSYSTSTDSMGTHSWESHSDKVLPVAAATSSSSSSTTTTATTTTTPAAAASTTVPSKTPVITPTVDSTSSTSSTTSTTSSSSSSSPTPSSTSSFQSPTTATVFSSSSTVLTSLRYTTKIITASIETAVNHGPKTVFLTTKSVIETVAHTVIAVQSDDPNFDLNKKNSSNGDGSSLSGGAIAGIVIGVIFGVIAILVLVVFLLLYKRKRAEEQRRLDLERTKQFQPYSFGDVNATPIILPPPSSSSANWKLPSRNNTGLSSRTLALSFSNNNNNYNNSKYLRTGTRGNTNSDDFDFDLDADADADFDFNFGSRKNSGSVARKGTIPQSHANSIASRRSAESFINNSNNYYYYSHVNRKSSTQPGFYAENNRNSNGSANVHAYGHIHNSAAERTYGGRRTSSGIRHPSTVFEEPTMSVYNGNERFSTSSLPDMMEQRRQLRIVNPDGGDGDGDSIEYLDGPSSPSDDNSYNEK